MDLGIGIRDFGDHLQKVHEIANNDDDFDKVKQYYKDIRHWFTSKTREFGIVPASMASPSRKRNRSHMIKNEDDGTLDRDDFKRAKLNRNSEPNQLDEVESLEEISTRLKSMTLVKLKNIIKRDNLKDQMQAGGTKIYKMNKSQLVSVLSNIMHDKLVIEHEEQRLAAVKAHQENLEAEEKQQVQQVQVQEEQKEEMEHEKDGDEDKEEDMEVDTIQNEEIEENKNIHEVEPEPLLLPSPESATVSAPIVKPDFPLPVLATTTPAVIMGKPPMTPMINKSKPMVHTPLNQKPLNTTFVTPKADHGMAFSDSEAEPLSHENESTSIEEETIGLDEPLKPITETLNSKEEEENEEEKETQPISKKPENKDISEITEEKPKHITLTTPEIKTETAELTEEIKEKQSTTETSPKENPTEAKNQEITQIKEQIINQPIEGEAKLNEEEENETQKDHMDSKSPIIEHKFTEIHPLSPMKHSTQQKQHEELPKIEEIKEVEVEEKAEIIEEKSEIDETNTVIEEEKEEPKKSETPIETQSEPGFIATAKSIINAVGAAFSSTPKPQTAPSSSNKHLTPSEVVINDVSKTIENKSVESEKEQKEQIRSEIIESNNKDVFVTPSVVEEPKQVVQVQKEDEEEDMDVTETSSIPTTETVTKEAEVEEDMEVDETPAQKGTMDVSASAQLPIVPPNPLTKVPEKIIATLPKVPSTPSKSNTSNVNNNCNSNGSNPIPSTPLNKKPSTPMKPRIDTSSVTSSGYGKSTPTASRTPRRRGSVITQRTPNKSRTKPATFTTATTTTTTAASDNKTIKPSSNIKSGSGNIITNVTSFVTQLEEKNKQNATSNSRGPASGSTRVRVPALEKANKLRLAEEKRRLDKKPTLLHRRGGARLGQPSRVAVPLPTSSNDANNNNSNEGVSSTADSVISTSTTGSNPSALSVSTPTTKSRPISRASPSVPRTPGRVPMQERVKNMIAKASPRRGVPTTNPPASSNPTAPSTSKRPTSRPRSNRPPTSTSNTSTVRGSTAKNSRVSIDSSAPTPLKAPKRPAKDVGQRRSKALLEKQSATRNLVSASSKKSSTSSIASSSSSTTTTKSSAPAPSNQSCRVNDNSSDNQSVVSTASSAKRPHPSYSTVPVTPHHINKKPIANKSGINSDLSSAQHRQVQPSPAPVSKALPSLKPTPGGAKKVVVPPGGFCIQKDEGGRKRKVAPWAQNSNLPAAIANTIRLDPNKIFPYVNTCLLDEIFPRSVKAEEVMKADRGQSGIWDARTLASAFMFEGFDGSPMKSPRKSPMKRMMMR
eukprot:TRINITY_DN33133_c1_g1_i1.p1 TRINITY_DN33133_c1_g1~~TRINITY_DN33133_c1_g1_i1.p1  ORF type:complete len:1289 (-),score=511.09 TRINITY_DN33133_c1_g1_i1:74-3940(-)